MAELLTKKEQKELLKIARDTIVDYVANGRIPPIETTSKGLACENGCFVTIKQKQQLRGCIGNFVSDKPLFRLVQEMAVSAATRDPRFYPMKLPDLDDFNLEISVLSPWKRSHRLTRSRWGNTASILSRTATAAYCSRRWPVEYGWDRETFLKHTCIKAGLPENAWQKECDIHIFSALVFGEPLIAKHNSAGKEIRGSPRALKSAGPSAFKPHVWWRVLGRQGRVGRRQPGNGHPEGRTGDIVQSDLVAEDDRRGVAAMLAANAQLDVPTGGAPFFHRHFDQLADTVLVQRHERIFRQDAVIHVERQKFTRIVAGKAKGGLGQVIGAEGEKFGLDGDLVGGQRRTGQLDHGADQVFQP